MKKNWPIPQSDDSDNEPWLDESSSPESEQEEEDAIIEPSVMRKQERFSQNALMIVNNHVNVNKESTEDFAFRNGPRRDGSIRGTFVSTPMAVSLNGS
jgi:hypothetical protein